MYDNFGYCLPWDERVSCKDVIGSKSLTQGKIPHDGTQCKESSKNVFCFH